MSINCLNLKTGRQNLIALKLEISLKQKLSQISSNIKNEIKVKWESILIEIVLKFALNRNKPSKIGCNWPRLQVTGVIEIFTSSCVDF